MKLSVNSITQHCSISLNRKQYSKLGRIEDEIDIFKYFTEKVPEINERGIEFNGHFGSFFYFEADSDEQKIAIAAAFIELMDMPLKDIKKLDGCK